MRLVTALVVTLGFGAWAQNPGGGVWTGYVNGWVPDQPRVASIPYALPYVAPYVTWPSYYPTEPVAPPAPDWERHRHRAEAYAAQQQAAADQAEADRRMREAESLRRAADDALAREQAAQKATQELAAEQLKLQQAAQELAAQRLAEKEATLKLAEEKAAAQRALELAEKDAAAKKLAAGPPEKGPDVYRWVDEDGVVHYSTRAPSDAKVKADKVGSH